jgi:ribosome modulation factor
MARKPTAPKHNGVDASAAPVTVSEAGIAANGEAGANAPEATATPPARALSNVSHDVIREYGRRLRSAKADTEEKRIAAKAAQKAVSSSVGFERAILKDAKRQGINTDRLIQMVETMSRDPEEVAREFAELNWYLKAMEYKTDSQLDILDYAAKITEGINKGVAITASLTQEDRDAVIELGKRAGIAGNPSTDNPYEEGSPDGLLWMGGWRDGLAVAEGSLIGSAANAAAAEAGAVTH